MTAAVWHTELAFRKLSAIDITERADAGFGEKLVELDQYMAEIELVYSNDEEYDNTEGVYFRTCFYNARNEKNGHLFHVNIKSPLQKDDLIKLRDFIDFLLK